MINRKQTLILEPSKSNGRKFLKESVYEQLVSSTLNKQTNIEMHFMEQQPEYKRKQAILGPLTQEEDKAKREYEQFFESFKFQMHTFHFEQIPKPTLQHHNIKILHQDDNYSNSLISNGNIYVNAKHTKHYGTQCTFDVIIGKFYLNVKVLNLHRISQEGVSSSIGSGSFGMVKEVQVKGKKIAIKKIKFNNMSEKFIISNLSDSYDQSSTSEIRDAIREYCMYKICSMLEIGPKVIFSDVYDLVCYNDCVEFQMQLCEKVHQCEVKKYQKDLKQRLKKLHSLKIVHKDLKPTNVVYSPSLKSYVFIDFGLACSVEEDYWQRTYTKPQGSLRYASQQMRFIICNKTSGRINLYINDVNALKISLHQVQQNQNKGFFTSELSQHFSQDCSQQSWNFSSDEYETIKNGSGKSILYDSSSSALSTLHSKGQIFQKYPSLINFYQMKSLYRILNNEKIKALSVENLKVIVKEQCQMQKKKEVQHMVFQLLSDMFFPTFDEDTDNNIAQLEILSYQNTTRIFGTYSYEVSDLLNSFIQKNNIKIIDKNKIQVLLQKIEKLKPKKQMEKMENIRNEIYQHKKLKNRISLMNILKNLIKYYEFTKEENLGLKRQILNLFLTINSEIQFKEADKIYSKIKHIVRDKMIQKNQYYTDVCLLDAVYRELYDRKWLNYKNLLALGQNYLESKVQGRIKQIHEIVKEKTKVKVQYNMDNIHQLIHLNYLQFYFNFNSKSYREAEKYVNENLRILDEYNLNKTQEKFLYLDYLSHIYIEEKRLDEAEENNEVSLKLKQEMYFPLKKGIEFSRYYQNKGMIEFERKNYQYSLQLFEECIDNINAHSEENKTQKDLLYNINNNIIMCEQALGNYHNVITKLTSLYDYCLRNQSKAIQRLIYVLQNLIKTTLKHAQFNKQHINKSLKQLVKHKISLIQSKRLQIKITDKLTFFHLDHIPSSFKHTIILKKVLITVIQPYLPYFRHNYFVLCSQVAQHYLIDRETSQHAIPYLWKYLTIHPRVNQPQSIYQQFSILTYNLITIKSSRMADKMLSYYIFYIPQQFGKLRSRAFKRQYQLKQQRGCRQRDLYSLIWKQKGYLNNNCYGECEKYLLKKEKCPIRRLILMKKLKKIKCDSFFEKGLKNSNENDNDLEVYKQEKGQLNYRKILKVFKNMK